MFELPVQLEVDGKLYPIRNKGDFRMVLDCFAALNEVELDNVDRILSSLIIFYEGVNSVSDLHNFFGEDLSEAAEKMFDFFNCGENNIGAKQNYKLIDWEKDSNLISSAINNVARTEIRSLEYLHWWTFMGYYLAIGDCPWSYIVSIREKIKKGKKLEKDERKFKIDNPNYFIWDSQTVEDKQVAAQLQDIWANQ